MVVCVGRRNGADNGRLARDVGQGGENLPSAALCSYWGVGVSDQKENLLSNHFFPHGNMNPNWLLPRIPSST